jgi:hypothetical protein
MKDEIKPQNLDILRYLNDIIDCRRDRIIPEGTVHSIVNK